MAEPIYLYNAGNVCIDVTGGWSELINQVDDTWEDAQITFNSNNVELFAQSGGGGYYETNDTAGTYGAAAMIYTLSKVSLDKVDCIRASVSRTASAEGHGMAHLAIMQTSPSSYNANIFYNNYDRFVRSANLGDVTLSLDVSDLTGEYYVIVANQDCGPLDAQDNYIVTSTTTVHSVWLNEPPSSIEQSYIAIANAARSLKSGYVGIENVARKIIKGYVGVNGVARLLFDCNAMSQPAPDAVLYYNGEDPSGLTGGFRWSDTLTWYVDDDAEDESTWDFVYSASNVTTAFETNVMHLSGYASDGIDIRCYATSVNIIDFTTISSIEITYAYQFDARDGTCALAYNSHNFEGYVGDYICFKNYLGVNGGSSYTPKDTPQTYTLDCSHINGKYYLVIALDVSDNSRNSFYVSKIIAHYK